MRLLKATAVMAALLFFAVLMLAVLSLQGLMARGAGGVIAGATRNGDVNCDGKVNLADAIYIIEWQFRGAEPPCALAQDNSATREELDALATRVLALEAASKKTGVVATGTYAGDGRVGRTIPTGLPGKLSHVQIFPDSTEAHPFAERMDAQPPGLVSGVTVSGPNFIVGETVIRYANTSGREYYWIAVSTPE